MRGIDFNRDWKFTLDETVAPHMNHIDDSTWKDVVLPHDWSVDFPFNKEEGDGCTGFLLGGMGWYRKHFITTEEMIDKEVWIVFDGIYNRSDIYCNGHFIDFFPYGYVPIKINLSSYLNPIGQDNLISVKVDHTRYADSRWYTGSGIYRKVSLYILPKVNIPVWGTYINTPRVSKDVAVINAETTICNNFLEAKEIKLVSNLYDPEGKKIDTQETKISIDAGKELKVEQTFVVSNPKLWDIHKSSQYIIQEELIVDNVIVQTYETKIGLRSFEFDVDKGFIFNGEKTLIKGVCLHHDAGLVGTAVPLDVWRRRLEKLKECGCNAIRTAHNPTSEDFLDLCDEMGFLVQEEFYDEWDNPKDKRYNGNEIKVDYITRGHAEFFKQYAKQDLQTVMYRDRNHPCIIQWSIGNEIEWTYPKYNIATGYFGAETNGNYFWTLPPYSIDKIRENVKLLPVDKYEIGDTAKKLAKWTKEIDSTRPVIANCILPCASYESGYTDALDMVGYSYRQVEYEYNHIHYPDKPIMGTENLAQWHEWKQILEKEYIPGIFLWTGTDYLGEAGHATVWPRKATRSGLLDLAGFEKPSYYMMKSLWSNEPSIYMTTQTVDKSLYDLDKKGNLFEEEKDAWKQRLWEWQDVNCHWNYTENQMIVVEVYSNCEIATLYLNDNMIEKKYLKDFEDHIYKWVVPFKPGCLKVIGEKSGEITEYSITTSSKISGIKLITDKTYLSNNLDEVAHIIAQLIDENGNNVIHQEKKIDFIVDGDCSILGVDNGDADSVQDYHSNSCITKHGKCMLILQGVGETNITIEAKSDNIDSINTISIKTTSCN
ncbi:glycoside hydrolase family 2 TIM barrel-domain containing protein [Paenibacillus sp. Dod16]|uniref:glycoside hydrolase family 2 TIM barrel-domain containing protein n=1 Tax=unclassified Paenibacillus TaxID=185978 RepID=UPI0035BFF035